MTVATDPKSIVARLSADARIKVKDSAGNIRWKLRDDITDTDVIQCKLNGDPIYMASQPGRKRKDGTSPVFLPQPKTDEVADWVRQRLSVIANDPILSALTQNPDSPLIIDEVLAAMARETASLEYDKIAAERTGQDPSGISNRRMKALRTLGETWLKKKREIDSSALDLDSPAFRTLFSHVMKTFEQAMVDTGLPREMVELVFDRVSKRMDGAWEQEIKTKIKNVIRGVPA